MVARRKVPLPRFRREVVGLLVTGSGMSTQRAIACVTARDPEVRRAWRQGQPPCNVADRLSQRVSRDPEPGQVFETRNGARWAVTGKTPKGRLLVRRAGHRYEGDLQWTPAMLARLKQVRKQEEVAVARAVAALPPPEAPKPGVFGGFLGGLIAPDVARPRRYYIYVIEAIHHDKREFYVGQSAHRPETRLRQHVTGKRYCKGCTKRSYAHGAVQLRKDLIKGLKPLYSRRDAERAERTIARALRKRGLRVRGGH